MTLVWAGYEDGPYMAADRRTTEEIGESIEPFDEHENKMLVVQALDALFILGYSGTAYVDGKPFDNWLAQIISELMPAPEAIQPDTLALHPPRRLRSAAYIAFTLKRRISAQPQIKRCDLVFAGYWQSKKAVVPLLYRWSKGWKYNADSARPFGSGPNYGDVFMVGDEPDQKTADTFFAETHAEIVGSGDRAGAMRVARFIQKCAAKSAYIGDNVNVVTMNANRVDVCVELFSGSSVPEPTIFADLAVNHNGVFSPWLLFETLTQPPTMMDPNSIIWGHPTVRFFNATEKPRDHYARTTVMATQVRKSWTRR